MLQNILGSYGKIVDLNIDGIKINNIAIVTFANKAAQEKLLSKCKIISQNKLAFISCKSLTSPRMVDLMCQKIEHAVLVKNWQDSRKESPISCYQQHSDRSKFYHSEHRVFGSSPEPLAGKESTPGKQRYQQSGHADYRTRGNQMHEEYREGNWDERKGYPPNN